MDQVNPAVDLVVAIDERLQRALTQSQDLSFNELLSMYESTPRELDIRPEYQRLFRWSTGTQSRFIESLLIEMPVPPIYVLEEDNGAYTLIDGLQRISSYFHLRGALEAGHLDPPINIGDRLELTDCDIVPELNGHTWDTLGTSLQLRLKRSFVRVEIVRRGSDPRFRYHMFKRLNTGGVILSEQQNRNCFIRLLDNTFNEFIITLSSNEDFKICTAILTQSAMLEAFDQELVLRFFALRNWRDRFKHSVSDFLTEYMEAVSDPASKEDFDYEGQKAVFEKTFSIMAKTLGELAFGFPNRNRDKISRGFSALRFEAFAIGLQARLADLDPTDDAQMASLKEVFELLQLDDQFVHLTTGGGKNSVGPLRDRIQFVETSVQEFLNA